FIAGKRPDDRRLARLRLAQKPQDRQRYPAAGLTQGGVERRIIDSGFEQERPELLPVGRPALGIAKYHLFGPGSRDFFRTHRMSGWIGNRNHTLSLTSGRVASQVFGVAQSSAGSAFSLPFATIS